MQRQQLEKHLSHKEGDDQYWLLVGCTLEGRDLAELSPVAEALVVTFVFIYL